MNEYLCQQIKQILQKYLSEKTNGISSISPGLVGGHCIGVDPYYLAYKAKAVNYEPEVILSGRRK